MGRCAWKVVYQVFKIRQKILYEEEKYTIISTQCVNKAAFQFNRFQRN